MREAELVGGELLGQATSVDPEYRDGLVATVEKTEEDRNQTLQKVDELRRHVRKIQAEIKTLESQNAELAQKLPGVSPNNALTQKK